MVTTQEYEEALEQVKGWPAEVRLHFAQDVLRSLLPLVRQAEGTPNQPAVPPADAPFIKIWPKGVSRPCHMS